MSSRVDDVATYRPPSHRPPSGRGGGTATRSSKPSLPLTGTEPRPSGTCFSTGGSWYRPPCSSTTIIVTTGSRSGPPSSKGRLSLRLPPRATSSSTRRARAAAAEPGQLSELRESIFPTIYAAFQQCRGGHGGLCSDTVKVRNRTLRSLTRSCLYHRKIEQLERTRKDAEELLQRLCARRQAYRLDPDVTPL